MPEKTESQDGSREQPALWISLQTVIQFALKFVRGFAIPKLLTPTLYGLYSSLGVALQYGAYADLGGLRLMQKRLPAVLSRSGEEGFRQELSRGLTWILITVGLAAGIAWCIPIFYSGEHLWFYRIGFPIVGLVLVTRRINHLLMAAIRSREEYKQLAHAGIAMMVVGAVFAIGLLWIFGIFGLVAGLLATEVVVFAYIFQFIPWPGLTHLSLDDIKQIAAQGLELQMLGISNVVLSTVDRLFLLAYFTKEIFGYYSLGFFVANTALSFTGIFRTVISPKFMRLFEEGEPEEAFSLMDDALVAYFIILLAGFPVGYFLLYPTVSYVLPQYSSALPVFYLMAGFAIVQGPMNMLEPLFIARDREKQLTGYFLGAAAVAALFNGIVVYTNGSMAMIVIASVAAFMILNVVLFWDFETGRSDQMVWFPYILFASATLEVIGFWVFVRRMEADIGIWRATGQLGLVSVVALGVCGAIVLVQRDRVLRAFRRFW